MELPQKLEEYLIQLSDRFEVSPLAVLLVTVIIVAAALGGGVVLVTTLWPSPITGSLDCALWDDQGRIRPVLDALAQPLRDAQDQRLSKLGDAGAKGIHQQIRDLEDQRGKNGPQSAP